MLLPLSGFVCVWFCSGAAEFHNQKTKTTFSPHESSAAERNVQGHRWLTVIGKDSGGPRGAGLQISELKSVTLAPAERFGPQTPRPCVRKTDAQSRVQRVRRKLVNKAGEQRSTPHGPLCTLEWKAKRGPNPVRTERSEPLPGGAAPAAMAQGQEAEPPTGLNISDYGEEEQDYEVPDYPDPTPLLPLDSRTRRKLLKNPFYPLSAEAMGAYAVLMVSAVIFIVGVIGNVSVMCIVCHNFYMRSISNSLLASLALWDFSVIFFCLPLVLFHQLTKTWLLGELSCKIIPYLEVASLGVTTFTLCALCIDRFRAATNVQMYYEMIENWVSTSAKLGVIWVGAMLLALPELLIRQLVTEDSGPPNVSLCERCVVRISTDLPDTLYVLGLTYDSARLWWYFGCYFCLPTLFTICSSLFTARKIRGAKRARVRASKKQNQLESQMNCVVVALAILYGFCIVPENICNIVGTYMAASVPQRTLDVLHVVSQLLLFCKSAAAPVLLFSLCQPFSQAFLNCCCCCCEECNPPPASDDHLEMLPPSADQREASDSATHAIVGTHC